MVNNVLRVTTSCYAAAAESSSFVPHVLAPLRRTQVTQQMVVDVHRFNKCGHIIHFY